MANLTSYHNNDICEKIGYKDEHNTIIIEPKYDSGVSCFGVDCYKKSPYGIVSIHGKFGAIDESGKIVIPIVYQEVRYLFAYLFAVRILNDNGEWVFGVINIDGDIIVPFNYKYIKGENGYIQCFKQASTKLIFSHSNMNTEGEVYNYSDCIDAVCFNENGTLIFQGNIVGVCGKYLAININNKIGLIDNIGHATVQAKYDNLIHLFDEYYAAKIDIDCEKWNFGIIDSNDRCVVDFKYKYIEGYNDKIFHCFDILKNDKSFVPDFIKRKDSTEYQSLKLTDEKWINLDNKIIYEGHAKILCCNLLAIQSYDKWGAVNFNGDKIVNFNYDAISSLSNFMIVAKNSQIGLLSNTGSLIIDPIYKKIECVNIEDISLNRLDSTWNTIKKHCSYSKEFIFDTNNGCFYTDGKTKDLLIHSEIKFPINDKYNTIESHRFDFSKYFILTTENYSEIFSFEAGIVHNSRYDYITQITNISFVVKRNGYYGVYRVDERLEIIPCKYDRIVFEGAHTVLLCKDGKWGAKSLFMPSDRLFSLFKVDIPIEYLEIKTLDVNESIFGVKREYTDWDQETKTDYIILLGKTGEVYSKLNSFSIRFDSQFTEYNTDKILTSSSGKYGFISSNGYVSIPFKYDEITERTDGDFDVRIENSWGILQLDGFEKSHIKYTEPLYSEKKHMNYIEFNGNQYYVVKDYLSNYKGVIDSSGTEIIPTIYEHIQIESALIFVGTGGFDYSDHTSSFFSPVKYGTWGCLDIEGNFNIPMKYDCFKVKGDYILAGRDGQFLQYGQDGYEKEYGGVYDLYDRNGTLLIGGFSLFERSLCEQYIFLYIGGEWKTDCCEHGFHDYKFIRKDGGWLIIDRDIKSMILDDNGKSYTFEKGKIITLTEKRDNKGKLIAIHRNMPVPLIKIPEEYEMPKIENGFLYEGGKYNVSVRRLSDNIKSDSFSEIKAIDKKFFFCDKEKKVGIATVDNVVLKTKYYAITHPLNGYVFTAYQKDDYSFDIELLNIDDFKFESISILKDIEKDEVDRLFYYSKLKLLKVRNGNKLEDYTIKDISISDGCKSIFSELPHAFLVGNDEKKYWFSAFDLSPYQHIDEDNHQDEYSDYAKDKWDAMTDGMYGDYPEGFDDDYDRFGF